MSEDIPNLLLIQADQLKPQALSFFGGAAVTPHLDRLAAEGAVFENAYCNFPLCAPSRFSMLAGMLPSRIGAYDNAAEFPASTPTVAHHLRLRGYYTVLGGKQHFVGPDMLHGFHQRLVPELYPTDFNWTPDWGQVRMDNNSDSSGVTKSGVCSRSVQIDHDEAVSYHANAALHDIARVGDRQPFFLVASFTHPHEPYFTTQRWWDLYRHEDIEMPATPLLDESERDLHSQRMLEQHTLIDGSILDSHVRIARHAYLANVSYFDHMVGKLLDTLEASGLADSTVVVVTSDHGDMLGERGMWYKKHFFDHAARIPLMCHAPWRFGASRNASNVSLVDLLPTLCDFTGWDAAGHAPEPLDGRSLVGLCDDPSRRLDDPVFAEITSEGVPCGMFMVRYGRFKLITGGDAPDLLFDLENDPQELDDLAPLAAHGETLDHLRGLAAATWDREALDAQIRLSQRRRHLVQAAHGQGAPPVWESSPGDPAIGFCLRGSLNYNDWAWRGIQEIPQTGQ